MKHKAKKCKGINKAKQFKGCEVMTVKRIYGLCDSCYKKWLLSTPEGKEKLKSLKINPQSDKRKEENKTYLQKRKLFLNQKENKICLITNKPATEIHHKYSGKDRDKYFLDVSTWLSVSREGHLWIHNNPKEAREKGYLY